MSEVEPLLELIKELSQENKELKARLNRLQDAKSYTDALSALPSKRGLSDLPRTQNELSEDVRSKLDYAVEMVLAYAKAVNFEGT